MKFHLSPLGDHAIVIETGKEINTATHSKVRLISGFLDEQAWPWMVEYVPAFTTVTLFYNPVEILNMADYDASGLPYEYVSRQLKQDLPLLTEEEAVPVPRIVEIPVLYGGEYGPDLGEVAEYNGLTPEKVIDLHTGGEYLVYMIGFAPGFPYIGGMNKSIAAPRRKSPRLKIPPGTVGIAGEQTGIYPIETPGGWQLIGRTPTRLFRPEKKSPSLLQAGDKIRFKAITEQEYQQWEEGE